MYKKILVLFIFALVGLVLNIMPVNAQSVKEPSSGVDFPGQVSVGGANATITGTGIRKRYGFKVYAIAAYLDTAKANKQQDPITRMLTDGPAKQITMHFVRDVGAAKVREAFQESLEKNIPSYATSPAKKNAEAFLAAVTDVATNDEIQLRWTQGGKLELIIKGQSKATFQDQVLARGVWSIWLGESPISADIKTGLIEKIK